MGSLLAALLALPIVASTPLLSATALDRTKLDARCHARSSASFAAHAHGALEALAVFEIPGRLRRLGARDEDVRAPVDDDGAGRAELRLPRDRPRAHLNPEALERPHAREAREEAPRRRPRGPGVIPVSYTHLTLPTKRIV